MGHIKFDDSSDEEPVVEKHSKKSKKKEQFEVVDAEEETAVPVKKSKKVKHVETSEAEAMEVDEIEAVKPKKKKKKHAAPEEMEDDSVKVNRPKKGPTFGIDVDDDDSDVADDIEYTYAHAERVEDIFPSSVKRLKTKDERDINNPIVDIDTEKDYDPNDRMEMPLRGILVEGIPFHHRHNYPLSASHIRRLFSHGVVIRTSKFTPQEDVIILKNWRRFAKLHNIPFDDAPLYMGWQIHLEDKGSLTMSNLAFNSEMKFFPNMCINLMHRAANQVYRRCYRIFDPRDENFAIARKQVPFTVEDDEKLLAEYRDHGPQWQKIAMKLKRNRFECQKRYTALTEDDNNGEPRYKPTKKYYARGPLKMDMVYLHVKRALSVHPVQLIATGVGVESERAIDWNVLARRFNNTCTPEHCQEAWEELKEKLRSAWADVGQNPKAPVDVIEKNAFGSVFEKQKRFSPRVASRCFKILHQLAKENDIMELFDIDTNELDERLIAADLTFRSVYTPAATVLRTVNRILCALRTQNFLRLLPADCSFVDLIGLVHFIAKKSRKKLKLNLSPATMLVFVHRYVIKKLHKIPLKGYSILTHKQLAAVEARSSGEESEGDDDDDAQSEDEQRERRPEWGNEEHDELEMVEPENGEKNDDIAENEENHEDVDEEEDE